MSYVTYSFIQRENQYFQVILNTENIMPVEQAFQRITFH